MKIDRDGRVYVAVALGVWVYEADGNLLGILSLPKRPSNLAWSGEDCRSLAITMVDEARRNPDEGRGGGPAVPGFMTRRQGFTFLSTCKMPPSLAFESKTLGRSPSGGPTQSLYVESSSS